MANRTGRSHSIQRLSRNVGISGTTPIVRYNRVSGAPSNAGRAEFVLGDVLSGISQRFEDRLDIMAEAEALEQGSLAGSAENLPTLQDEATIRGRAFNRAARDAAAIRVDLEGRQILSDYEDTHKTDAGTFRQKADAYLQGQLPQLRAFDPALAQRFAADYQLRSNAAEGRIKERHAVVLRDQQLEQVLRQNLAIQDDLSVDAASLFSGSAENAQETFERMISNSSHMIDGANQIGPDGKPLFSARERVALERQAQQQISEQIGLAWMRTQTDNLQAYQDWRNGKAEIVMVDDEGQQTRVNLKTMLGERGYMMASEAFTSQLRSEIALQNQLEAQQDRAFKDQSDALFSDLTVLAQEGGLTLNLVEASRRSLEPERYLALRQIAKGGFATVDDTEAVSRLMERDANGEDITAELNASKSQLTRERYLQLYDRNLSRIDRGVRDSVDTGRDFLTKGLGALSREIGFAQSAAIGGAQAEYDIEIEKFIAENQRQPTTTEARDIAETVRSRYSVLSVEDSLVSLPLPRSLTQAEKLSRTLSAEQIKAKMAGVKQLFLKKHSGNAEAMANDPEYQREVQLLKKYYDLLEVKEKENGRRAN